MVWERENDFKAYPAAITLTTFTVENCTLLYHSFAGLTYVIYFKFQSNLGQD